DLSANLLRDNATDGLGNLSFLTDLKLSKNFLSRIPNLRWSRSHNDISVINGSPLIDLPNLATLDLSNNQELSQLCSNLLRFYKHFDGTVHFVLLESSRVDNTNLNNNRIISIEKGSFDNLGKLVELKLNRNHLSRFNKELFKHLKYLKVLKVELRGCVLTLALGESGKPFRENHPRYTQPGLNLDLPVFGSLDYCESSALDYATTKAET
ncbi:unnamed protein product, partial [Timema podura]|nr:unnamed protein product [Timema podura]